MCVSGRGSNTMKAQVKVIRGEGLDMVPMIW